MQAADGRVRARCVRARRNVARVVVVVVEKSVKPTMAEGPSWRSVATGREGRMLIKARGSVECVAVARV